MKEMSASLKPACLIKNTLSLFRMASNLALSQSTVSSLLIATQSCDWSVLVKFYALIGQYYTIWTLIGQMF